MCDFFEQTGCLEADCDSTAESYPECTALIGESLSTCQLTCMFTHGKPEAESKCAACLDDAMMSSFDISEDQASRNTRANTQHTHTCHLHRVNVGLCVVGVLLRHSA